MKLNLQVSERDYMHARFVLMRPTRITRILFNILKAVKIILLLSIIYALAESIYELIRGHGNFPGAVFILAIGIYLTWDTFFRWPQISRQYYRKSNYHITSECDIDETFMSYHNSLGNIQIPWESFSKWQESQHLFILYATDNKLCFSRWKENPDSFFTGSGFDIFPKHCFSSGQDVDDFRKLLTEKIRHGKCT